jgi:hypothetical protein
MLMRQALSLLFFLLIAGCDQIEKGFMNLEGFNEQTVVLSSQPFELTAEGRTITSKEQMKSLGISSVCVVLKTHYPMAHKPQMDRDFESLLQGTKISATLTDTEGHEHLFDSVGMAWNMNGAVSYSEELSACVSCACGSHVPVGSTIKSVHIRSDRPLGVLGAYWHSMPNPDAPKG